MHNQSQDQTHLSESHIASVNFLWGFQTAIVFASIWKAISIRWLSDDAFISFRYAKHWSEGHGLVYNVGEWVEGYTNLLWTLWIGLGMMIGWQPEWFAHASSISAYAVMLGVLSLFRHRSLSIPLVLVAGMAHVRSFATSGLETQWFLTLIVLFIWALRESRWKLMWGAMVLGMLTRPEGGLLWASVLPVLWVHNRNQVVKTVGIGVLTLVGLELWRWFTYGAWLPNTFYAKAESANWSQGWLYIRLFFQMYWFVPLGWIAAIPLLKQGSEHRRWAGFALVFSSLYAIHVMRVGGDFMMARFALPWAVPLIMLLGTWIQEQVPDIRKGGVILLLATGVSVTAIAPSGLDEINNGVFGIEGITEESHWYTEEWRHKAELAGKEVQPLLKDTPIQVVIYGAQAMFAYYAELPYALEGMTGLTDAELARFPSRENRVGHGRKATISYLQSRGIDLYIDFRLNQGAHPLNQIQLGPLSGSLISYKKDHVKLLRERGAEFQDFEEYLDWYIDTLAIKTPEERERDLVVFQNYYFQFSDDPADAERLKQLTIP